MLSDGSNEEVSEFEEIGETLIVKEGAADAERPAEPLTRSVGAGERLAINVESADEDAAALAVALELKAALAEKEDDGVVRAVTEVLVSDELEAAAESVEDTVRVAAPEMVEITEGAEVMESEGVAAEL